MYVLFIYLFLFIAHLFIFIYLFICDLLTVFSGYTASNYMNS
jgi:hypothetical protein